MNMDMPSTLLTGLGVQGVTLMRILNPGANLATRGSVRGGAVRENARVRRIKASLALWVCAGCKCARAFRSRRGPKSRFRFVGLQPI